ncbi:reverse transcriptase domain-containing protein [Tanacetum coccineum]
MLRHCFSFGMLMTKMVVSKFVLTPKPPLTDAINMLHVSIKRLKLGEGDLGHTQASNQRSLNLLPRKGRQYCSLVIYHKLFLGDLSYVDVHPFHDYEKWDTFGRFIEKSSAYKPWIYLLEFEIELLVLKKLHVGLSPLHSMTVRHDEIEKRKERAGLLILPFIFLTCLAMYIYNTMYTGGNGGDTGVATRPKSNKEDGDGDDAEQNKLSCSNILLCQDVPEHRGTPNQKRWGLKERLRPRHVRSRSGSPEPRRDRPKSPKKKEKGSGKKSSVQKVGKRCVPQARRQGEECVIPREHPQEERYTEALSECEDSEGGHWKSRSKKKKSCREEDDLSQPWVCEEVDHFTPRIRYFDFPKTRMPSPIKTYDGSEDPKDHLKIFQAAAKTERWAMPTWYHMFNSTLTGNARVWFDDLPPESIDSCDDMKKAFLENYLEQKKCIKDPLEIYNIKQREGESTEDFVKRYKLESRDVKGAPECMRIFGFVHGITNPELIKRLHDKILKIVNEMMRGNQKQNFKKEGFRNQQRSERKQERFSLLTKTPKEIFALDKGKFKAPPPMKTPIEKRNHAKFCEFHGEVGHNIDECMHLRKQIEEMLKGGKLSYLIKELKQNNRKEQPKVAKKGETSRKDKALAILMVQP